MRITDLKILKGFDRERFPRSPIYYRHEIEIAAYRKMKILKKTKVGVLNPNLRSEISYEEIFKNCQHEAVS